MLLNDRDIRCLCSNRLWTDYLNRVSPQTANALFGTKIPMIDPFSEGVQDGGVISYGLSHAGYDLRMGYEALVYKNTHGLGRIDPKAMRDDDYRNQVLEKVTYKQGDKVWIPPNGYILGYSLEYLRIPRHLKGRCVGKSSLARAGIIVNTTPLEPNWCGHLTIEIANATPCPVCLYAGEGCAQLEFETLTAPPEVDYAQKDGKYQDQGPEPVPARVKE